MKSFFYLSLSLLIATPAVAGTQAKFYGDDVVIIKISGDGDSAALYDQMIADVLDGPDSSQFKFTDHTTQTGEKVYDLYCERFPLDSYKDNCNLVIYGNNRWVTFTVNTVSLQLGETDESNTAAASFAAPVTNGLIFNSSDHAVKIRSEDKGSGFQSFSITFGL